MDCCDNICGGGSACDPLDGISMREVMECLRGVSHDELINQLESIGFRFNEQDMIRQLNKFDAVSKRRIVKQAGRCTLCSHELLFSSKQLPPPPNVIKFFWKISENIITKRFETEPETFNFSIIFRVTV